MKLILLVIMFCFSSQLIAENISFCIQGWKHTESGDHKRAIELFQKCIKDGNLSNSSLARTYRNIGIANKRHGMYKEAIKNYDKAIALKPNDPWDDYVNRGNAWSELGDYKKSLSDYEKALEVKPNYNEAYYNRGIIFEKQNNIPKAIVEFKLAYKNGLRSEKLHSRYAQYGLMEEITNPKPLQILHSKPLQAANTIKSVWTLSSQPCNGGGGNAMQGHPKEKHIKTSKTVVLDSLGLKILVPQLPDINNTHVKLYLGDTSRGVVDNYFLLTEEDLSPPFAAIVITELPAHLQTSDSALDAVKVLQGQLAFKANIDINLDPITSQYGDGLELVVENRIGSHCFPTSDFQFIPKSSKNKTIGISRFSMINKKLVEFALIVDVSKGVSKDESIEIAKQLMDGYWLSLQKI